MLAGMRAGDEAISVQHIRGAAKDWYERAKKTAVAYNKSGSDLLYWIIDEVIAHRRARAFLLQSDVTYPLIESLFDARVLHVVKKGVSSNDRPGVRFNVYKLDFGCYVDLITTKRAPQGLFSVLSDTGTEIMIEDVPSDDYRSIRNAVLEIEKFKASHAALPPIEAKPASDS